MTEQESADLDTMQRKIQGLKNVWYSYSVTLSRANESQLRTLGYVGKSNGEAMLMAFQSFQKQIDDACRAYLRKYPDQTR